MTFKNMKRAREACDSNATLLDCVETCHRINSPGTRTITICKETFRVARSVSASCFSGLEKRGRRAAALRYPLLHLSAFALQALKQEINQEFAKPKERLNSSLQAVARGRVGQTVGHRCAPTQKTREKRRIFHQAAFCDVEQHAPLKEERQQVQQKVQ
jgi:hypothetical protein